ncbi:MAG: Bax inhibitor-1/YccA family protein [Thiovulaceae bacterium]|nr:Bax inhibitor-1/YccA family protein [Sulfurimonadaceae bacterium]
MGLYDRDYASTTNSYEQEAARSGTGVVAFVKDTYKLFAASMMAGAAGAYVGIPFAAQIHANSLVLFVIEIALLFGLFAVKRKAGINLVVMFAFTFMTGITLAPLLSMAMVVNPAAIGNAFAMTAVVFGAMSLFAIKTTKDFTTYTKPLMIALIVVIVFSLLNAFLFHNPMMGVLISGAVVMLFSILVVYDTQNIIRGGYDHPIDGAIALYLDFLNIFTALLQLILAFGNDD